MTTGSWSIGDFGTGLYAASKTWGGPNGRTESWHGGIRSKWNSYTLTHQHMTQLNTGFFVTSVPAYNMSTAKAAVGWSSNDDLRLLNKLAEAVRGHSFDLGVNIAEATKSYDTVVSNVRSVGQALWHLKHGRISQATRVLTSGRQSRGVLADRLNSRTLSGRWLETQYAFLPLLSQSYEAAKALQAVTKYRVLKFRVSSGPKATTVDVTASSTNYHGPCGLSYRKAISAELYEDISLNRSLGLVNPAEIAWELVPYSFVVDWFLPIGSYISAWGVIPSLTGRFMTAESYSVKRKAITVGSNPNSTSFPKYAASNRREKRFGFSRSPSSSLAIPRPTFNALPKALSARRLTSAVALIHQMLR
jgi:hypothetical protein